MPMPRNRPKTLLTMALVLAIAAATALQIARMQEDASPRLMICAQVRSTEEPKPDVFKALDLIKGKQDPFAWRLFGIDPERPDSYSKRDAPEEILARKFWPAPGREAQIWTRSDTQETHLWFRNREGRERKLMQISPWDVASGAAFSPDRMRAIVPIGKLSRPCYANWLVEADGPEPAALPLPETDLVLDWSPDGRLLLTVSLPADGVIDSEGSLPPRCGLRLVGLDGAEARKLATCRIVLKARFSPDGRTIAFTGIAEPDSSDNGLWVIGADGSGLRKIADFSRQKADLACWSPDGKQLAITATDRLQLQPTPGLAGAAGQDRRAEVVDLDDGDRHAVPIPAPYELTDILWWR